MFRAIVECPDREEGIDRWTERWGKQKEGVRFRQPAANFCTRAKKQLPDTFSLSLSLCIYSSIFFLFYPFFYSSLSIHYQSNPFIFAPWVLMGDNNSFCACVCAGCSLPTEAEQSSVITQTLSWPALPLSSTLNGGVCVCVWACMCIVSVSVCLLDLNMTALACAYLTACVCVWIPVCECILFSSVCSNCWSPPGVNCYGCCSVEITVICFL